MKYYLYLYASLLAFMPANVYSDNIATALELALFANNQAKLRPKAPAAAQPVVNLDALSFDELKEAIENKVPGAIEKLNELIKQHDTQIVQANEKTHNASWYSRISLENRISLDELKRKLKAAKETENKADIAKYSKEIDNRHKKILDTLKNASSEKRNDSQERINAADRKIMKATGSSKTFAQLKDQYLEAKNAGASIAITSPLANAAETRLEAIKEELKLA